MLVDDGRKRSCSDPLSWERGSSGLETRFSASEKGLYPPGLKKEVNPVIETRQWGSLRHFWRPIEESFPTTMKTLRTFAGYRFFFLGKRMGQGREIERWGR